MEDAADKQAIRAYKNEFRVIGMRQNAKITKSCNLQKAVNWILYINFKNKEAGRQLFLTDYAYHLQLKLSI